MAERGNEEFKWSDVVLREGVASGAKKRAGRTLSCVQAFVTQCGECRVGKKRPSRDCGNTLGLRCNGNESTLE